MSTYIGRHYKLRAGSPMPTSRSGHFVLHTFMAATNDSIIESCTDVLPRSSDFIGNGAGGTLQSASFSRLPVSSAGAALFRGQYSEKELYDEEYAWGFN